MFLLPYHVDVPMSRWPFMNFLLIGGTVVLFVMLRARLVSPAEIEPYILQLGEPKGIYGHIFVHLGALHIFGNMMSLWVFGNAVCAKIGNFTFCIAYLVLGCIAGLTHLLINGAPAIGASGAINGVVGMYLVFYPTNNISCLYWFIFRIGTFSLSSIWIILLFLAFDIYGVASGGGQVAYWAHLGGFASGFLLASLLLHFGLVKMAPTEDSLYKVLRS